MLPAVPGFPGEGEMLMALVADWEVLPEAWYVCTCRGTNLRDNI